MVPNSTRYHEEVNGLRQCLTDVCAGVEESVIHDAVEQRCRRLQTP